MTNIEEYDKILKSLDALEGVLADIEHPTVVKKVDDFLQETYVYAYNELLDSEGKRQINAGIRHHELEEYNIHLKHEFMEKDGWYAAVYKSLMWETCMVEVYDTERRLPNYDYTFHDEETAVEWAKHIVQSKNRPWG